jgi:predicted enzyme related to lactoylglutathione lyase
MPKNLPPKPNLGNIRKQAKHLLRAYKAGDGKASRLVSGYIPSRDVTLRLAHYILAREYGFQSWADLVAFTTYRPGGHIMPNRINWFWIPARELDRAAEFYRKVLACEVWIHREDGFAIFEWQKGEVSGGLKLGQASPSDQGIRILLNCEGRLDTAVEAARKGGGTITSLCSLGNFGFQVIVIDTEGNTIHLHSFGAAGAEITERQVKEAPSSVS